MPRAQIVVSEIPKNDDVAVTFTAGNHTDDMYFNNDGSTLLLCTNAGAATLNVTVVSVTDENNRTGDVAIPVSAATSRVAGPFKPAHFNQRGSSDLGKIFVNLDVSASVTMAALKYKPV